MSNSYRFLAHEIFQKNIKDFLGRYPEFKRSLFTNLEKARSNPFSGKSMHSLPKKFRQKVFRLWIGGPKDFRFIYYVDSKSLSVLGIYITLVPKSEFSYDKIDWLNNIETIVADLENKKYNKFAIMKTEEAIKTV